MPSGRTSPAPRGGVDLGGTKIEAVVVGARNKVLGSARQPTPTTGTPADVATAIGAAIREASKAAGLETSALAGIGVGSPGVVDEASGAVSSARNLPSWDGTFELGATLSSELGAPVFVGNDVQVATEAEFHLGAGKPYTSLLGVFWGTGVGGGLILGGKPWLGRGGAGEIGHIVVKIDGARCTCGRRGCMEAYAGRAAMEARARKRVEKGHRTDLFKLMEERGRTRVTSAIWAHALERGDKLATEIIDEAIVALGAGIASAVNVLDVEAVILGGGLGVRFGEPFAKRISKAMQPHLFHDEHPPEVKVASLGDLGGAIGAALLAKRAPRTVDRASVDKPRAEV
jgi:glucokinase